MQYLWYHRASPIKVDVLKRELANHPDKAFVSYLICGFEEGFDLGIEYLPDASHECKNNVCLKRSHKDDRAYSRRAAKGIRYWPL